MRKALGWLMLAIGVSGIILSIVGMVAGRRLINAIGESLQANLGTTVDNLDTVRETLILTKSILTDLDSGLETAQETAGNVSTALSETAPLLEDSSQIVTQDVPESIETFQTSLPALIDVASTIDSTLRTLSAFNFNRTILGIPLNLDLGVDYDPDVPFDESVAELGTSLEGLPEQLRGLQQYIDSTNDNLLVVSQDVARLSGNLESLDNSMNEVEPLVENYIAIVTDLSDGARQSRLQLAHQLDQARLVLTLVMVWFGLLQVAPIYLGWEIVSGRRDDVVVAEPVVVAQPDADLEPDPGLLDDTDAVRQQDD